MRKKPNPKCSKHYDCFANKCGECIALTNNNFGNKDCSFYSKLADHIECRIAAAEKLRASGRIDLIEKYYTSVAEFEQLLAHDKTELSSLFVE